eukprot:gene9553-10540_t
MTVTTTTDEVNKFSSKTELVDDDGGKKTFSIEFQKGSASGLGRTALIIIAVVCLVGIACLIAGIVLMTKSSNCKGAGTNGSSSTGSKTGGGGSSTDNAGDQCKFSDEAKRIGLEKFLNKVKSEYYKQHPQNTAWHPDLASDKEKIRRDYAAYDPTPAKIKARTDAAWALLSEIEKQKENPNLLKPREYKALLQVKHYLKYMFGNPYDENYYAGDWMLGPNSFCWQAMCSLSYDINGNIGKMPPRNYKEIEAVLKHIRDINATVMQYVANMKLGVKTGMVRTRVECTGGMNAIKPIYEQIYDNGPQGVFKEWYTKKILNTTTFLKYLSNDDQMAWKKNNGKTVYESIRNATLKYIGEPLHAMLKYIEFEHYSHCRPDNLGAGGLSALPIDYIYTNGTPGVATTKTLPLQNKAGAYPPVNGNKSYEMILGYFTTKSISPNAVHDLGKKMLARLYPQVIEIAKNVTQIFSNETMAVESFQKILTNISVSFFNNKELPKNESSGDAFKLCKTIEGAKKYCPNRWRAMEKWFEFSRMVMAKLDPKTVNMFFFTGDKHTTPNCPVDLKPDFNPTSGAQSYLGSTPQCTRNAIYNIPFFLKNLGPKFSEYSVNAHEARPGHHTQVQGNTEHFKDKCGGVVKWLDDQTYYTAFTEGWAFAANGYIQRRVDAEIWHAQIWRALRLIVDTGLHFKGFSRQQALDLFAKYAWDKSDLAEKEVLRYQSNPGQATAYMIGQLDIWKYRNDTQNALGDKFSLKEFHFQTLSQGSSPLSYLESHLKKYTACKLDPKKAGCKAILDPKKPMVTSSASAKASFHEDGAAEEEFDKFKFRRLHHF